MKLTLRAIQALIVWSMCHSLGFGSEVAQTTNTYSPRQALNLNTNWEFFRGEDHPQGADGALSDEVSGVKESIWETVHLPHTPQVEPKEFKMSWQGVCWYRRGFIAEPEWRGRRVTVKFEAVMQRAEVWVNGRKASTHDGGYLPFSIDVTDDLIYDGKTENIITVKADNRDVPDIPPGKPQERLDFTYQGGIYRDVRLFLTDKLHVTDAVEANQPASGGVFVSFPSVTTERAVVEVKTHVANHHSTNTSFQVESVLVDRDGAIVLTEKTPLTTLAAGKDGQLTQTLTVENPQLWHPDSPYLYTLHTRVVDGSTLIDTVTTRIGIRTVEWKNNGFFINGKKLTLNGANRHQDGIYVGNALPANVQRLDAKKLREAGFNNVRAGHYPLDPAFMDACDEFGLTVVACIPGWQHFSDTDTFKSNSYQNVRDLVRRDRNHPSVILYETVLNESRYSEEYAQTTHRICKEEDPYSFTVCDYQTPAADLYDVNYKVPDESKPFFTREWGDDNRYPGLGNNKKGRRSWGDWALRSDEHSMVYQSLARQKDLNGDGYWDWHGVNKKSTTAGYALWVGMDHNRGNNPDIAGCGVWGLDRYPKFCLYFLQSQRDPSVILDGLDSGPMAFIGSFWRESSLKDVNVYSNCEQVRLYLNDSLIAAQSPDHSYDEGDGEKPVAYVPHPMFTFKAVPWQSGVLRAEGLIGGKVVAQHAVRTPEQPKRLVVEMDHIKGALTADGSDMALLFIKAVDANGTLTPDFDGMINVDLGGEGRLIGANPVKAEGGVAAIWLRSTTAPGTIKVSARSESVGVVEFTTTSRLSTATFVRGPARSAPIRIRRVEAGAETEEKFTGVKVDNLQVAVSSSLAGSSKTALLDGDRETWWFAANNANESVELQLPRPTNLIGSLIVWEKDSTWYDFTISVSADGKTWRQVYASEQTGHDFFPEEWQANGVSRVRVSLSKVTPSDSRLGIREIELYRAP